MKRFLYCHSPNPIWKLGEACLTLTPKVSVPKSQDLFLDLSATEKYFGGEALLLEKADGLFSTFGLSHTRRLVVADRAEWVRAFASDKDLILPRGKSQEALYRLPLSRLTECGDPMTLDAELGERLDLIAFMYRVGLRSIREFAALGSGAIGRRFGKKGAVLQEWATGKRELCLPPFTPVLPLLETLDAEDLSSLDALLFVMQEGLLRLEARLRGRAHIAKQMRLTFSLESRQILIRELTLSDSLGEAQSWLRLLHDFLGSLHWDSPLKTLDIEITASAPKTSCQLSLFDNSESRFQEIAEYVSRLKARWGDEAAGFPKFQNSHLPEKSWALVFPPEPPGSRLPYFPDRPLFLFNPPREISPSKTWRITLCERLSLEGWADPAERTYYTLQPSEGERLWIFWDEIKKRWFLHGSY